MGYFIVYTPSGWKGRSIGALKEITDNRCSRHQAEVLVTDSGLMLTCVGLRSVVVRPSEETEESYNVSQKGSTELKDGDCFALPGQLEFQVFGQGVGLDKKGVGFMEKEKKSEENKEMKPEKEKKAKKESEEREKLKTLREPCRNKYSHPCKFGSECYRTSANHLKEFNHPWDTPVDPEVSDEEEEKPEVKAKDTKAKPAKVRGRPVKRCDREQNPFFVASQDDYEPPTVKKKGKGEEGPKQKKQKKAENETLEGKSFAFTGTHSVVRKQLQEIVLEHGGLFHAGVSGKTDFLVATSMECMHGTSKARNAGVTIVSEQFLIDSVQNEKLMDASNYQIDEEN
ncbi:hypothetical protein PROFUN_12060 [Planoprotostelium fungivorum]|uniref:BRCT domain-containing protein n=1 Tax=Planoprotostelium fungivorum TaxID=1890364 RepID=A0A2P6MXN1_9EUKA|nr:hypothetical protein PROFUN_12060 [Planoprotostelium fungivorum]